MKDVRANGNGAGIRLDAPGVGNAIRKCSAHANNGPPGGAGIAIANGNTGNVVQKNVALGNDGQDLDDGNRTATPTAGRRTSSSAAAIPASSSSDGGCGR